MSRCHWFDVSVCLSLTWQNFFFFLVMTSITLSSSSCNRMLSFPFIFFSFQPFSMQFPLIFFPGFSKIFFFHFNVYLLFLWIILPAYVSIFFLLSFCVSHIKKHKDNYSTKLFNQPSFIAFHVDNEHLRPHAIFRFRFFSHLGLWASSRQNHGLAVSNFLFVILWKCVNAWKSKRYCRKKWSNCVFVV